MDRKFLDRGPHSRVTCAAKLIGGCVVLALAASSAFAHSGVAASKARVVEIDPGQTPITQQLTISLIDASQRLGSVTGLKRAQSHADLVTIARDRYDALKALVEADPAEVLRVALPAEMRANLEFVLFFFRTLGLNDYRVRLGFRDPASTKYVGSDEDWNTKLKDGIREIFELTVALGGTLSGEHGIGLVQKEFMPIKYSEVHFALWRGIKQVFDKNGILNPGKIFNTI